MNFISDALETYVETFTSEESMLLKEVNRTTWEKVLQPRMLSGHVQGRVLSLFSKLKQPKNILEIGTYTGYSALCLAEGLHKDGQIDTIEKNEELKSLAKSFFDKSEYAHQIKQHIGNALEIIPSLNTHFDLVFIDADKENYCNYLDLIISKVNKGGIIIADNVLWSGKVINETEQDEETEALRAYVNKVNNHTQLENILLAIRDGLMIARKL